MTRNEFIEIFGSLSRQTPQRIQPTVNTDLFYLINVVCVFLHPPVAAKNQVEHAIIVNRGLVAGEFARLYIDKGIQANKLERQSGRELKEIIRLQAQLWIGVWKTIQQMYTLSLVKPALHESQFFMEVIMEQWLTEPFLTSSDTWDESLTATKMFKRAQNQNRSLQTTFNKGVNPCDRHKQYTWILLEQGRDLAERSDEFRKQYLKMVEARMALVDFMRHTRPKITSVNPKIKPERRGRKPKTN
jgi:hypothetical protein